MLSFYLATIDSLINSESISPNCQDYPPFSAKPMTYSIRMTGLATKLLLVSLDNLVLVSSPEIPGLTSRLLEVFHRISFSVNPRPENSKVFPVKSLRWIVEQQMITLR